jgi:hypothetical protein
VANEAEAALIIIGREQETIYISLTKQQWVARGGVVLRHYATNRQVAGSIPDGVIGIFQ